MSDPTPERDSGRFAAWVIELATWLTCLNPAFAIWAGSGLENGMTALLVGLACWHVVRSLPRPRTGDVILSGLIAGLLFANMKPTFIRMWQSHAWKSGLTQSERFHEDYLGLETTRDAWIERHHGGIHLVGSFVRKDALPEGMDVQVLLRQIRDR